MGHTHSTLPSPEPVNKRSNPNHPITQPPNHQQTNMPANRASKGPREASRNSRSSTRSKASGNTGVRAAPNRRQMRRMQANGLSARKPRRPEGAAEQGDVLSPGADNGIQIQAQRMPDKDSWAAKMHSIADLTAIARLKREEAEAEEASEASASE